MDHSTDRIADAAWELYDHDDPIIKDGIAYPRLVHDRQIVVGDLRLKAVSNSVNGSSFVLFGSNRPGRMKEILLQMNGYQQLPTAMLTDKILKPIFPAMEEHRMIGVAYAPGGRGRPDLETHQGWWGIDTLRQHTAQQIRDILLYINVRTFRSRNLDGHHWSRPPVTIIGHSQGGQMAAWMMHSPEDFGLTGHQIYGATLINPVGIPYSQRMLTTPGFLTDIALRSLGNVTQSLVTGKGVLFRGKKAFNAFIGEGDINGTYEKRLIESTCPGEGAYFVQTLLSNTSPSLDGNNMYGTQVSIVSSQEDQLMSRDVHHATYEHFNANGINTAIVRAPGKHFSPILRTSDESPERVEAIMHANTIAFEHALDRSRFVRTEDHL